MEKLSSRAKEIAEELERSEPWRSKGKLTTTLIATIVSAIPVPIVSGPASILIDKLGEFLFNPKLEPKFIELCKLISDFQPELEKLDDLEERVSLLAAIIKKNEPLLKQLENILSNLQLEIFSVSTVGGLQEFIDVTISNMNILIEAHKSGRNYLHEVHTSGGKVQFNSTTGGYNRVEKSTFTGNTGNTVGMNKLTLQGSIETINSPDAGISMKQGSKVHFGSEWAVSIDEQGGFCIGIIRK